MAPYFFAIESMRASSFGEFRDSMSHWGAPTLNHVYADVKGNIGWLARGLSPKRVNWDCLLPVPGDGSYEWAGFWRGDELPHVFNPAEGWFATANQLNLPRDYPYKERKLGFEWTNPSRYSRVAEVLGSTEKVSLEDCKRLQNDVLSIPARRLVKLLAGLNPPDPKARAAVELLQGWDFKQQQGSGAAALFEVWQARHLRKAFRETMLPQSPGVLPSTDMRVLLEALEIPGRSAGKQRSELFATTLAAAYSEMETLQGSDSRKWQWGRLHYNLCEHSFSGAVEEAIRGRINVGPLAKHGSEYTPNQSQYRGDDFRQSNGPSFRIIVDVGDWDNSQVVNHPGQSGDPESAHYRDLAPLWLRGEYFPLLYSRAAIERETERRIQLRPANDRD
jgi:penicillin amidase